MRFLFIFATVKKKQHGNTTLNLIELSATCFHQLEDENFDSAIKDCCKHWKHVKHLGTNF